MQRVFAAAKWAHGAHVAARTVDVIVASSPRNRPALLPARLAEAARSQPDAEVLFFRDESWSRQRLLDRVVHLHGRLSSAGLRMGDRALVALERGPDLLAALLACHRAGVTSVPIDLSHPRARVEAVTASAAPRAALVDRLGAPLVPAGVEPIRVDEAVELPFDLSAVDVHGDLAAYMLFTSGSTGRPKGVVIPHRALEAFLHAIVARLGLSSGVRVFATATVGFDISVLELFVPLWLDGAVELADEETRSHPGRLAAWLDRRPGDVVQATPTQFRLLVQAGWMGRPNLTVLSGGEAMTEDLALALVARGDAVFNLYGPTECTVWATAHRVTRAAPTPYLGAGLDGVELEIRGPDGPVDDGELWIGGPQVGSGYFRDPDKTEASFVAHPDDPERTMYRTGDRVLRTPEGLVFKGRLDHQVKVGGVRIELGEVEAALAAHPSIAQCAALKDEAEDALIAYVVVREGEATPLPTALAAHLDSRVYRAAWPSRYVWLPAMPLTATGKIDRNALRPVPAAPPATAAVEPPRGDIEGLIAQRWKRVLGLDRDVGREEDFYALGGTSKKALSLLLEVERALGLSLATATFVARPTVAAQAEFVRAARGPAAALDAVLLSEGGGPPIFGVCGIMHYLELAARLGGIATYGVSVALERALWDGTAVPSVEALAEQTEAAVRAASPRGPYRLMGSSFGGVVAFEVGRRLLDSGAEVEGVVVLDSVLGGEQLPPLRWARELRKRLRRDRDRWTEASDLSQSQWLRSRRLAPTPLDLFVVRARHREDGWGTPKPCLGWSPLVASPPAVVDVPGDHLGILHGEGAEQLGWMVRGFFERRGARRVA